VVISAGLSDLDELVLHCRGASAKSYVGEAVSCYKAGAYRSAIVATWIAVLYDFLDKLRELEMAGDANARARIAEFEKARQASNWKACIEFERSVIGYARDEFELLSPPQADDLERLAEDRNRCAHPSMTSAEEPYQATAELARTHLKNAVLHMLSHPPVQGKAALDRIMGEIASEYFPETQKEAVEFLKTGPLARARRPLVRNLILVLSKELLLKGWTLKNRARRFAALTAVVEMYREIGEATIKESVSGLLSAVPDDKYYRSVLYVAHISPAWALIGTSAQIKIRNYIESAPEDALSRFLHEAVRVPELRQAAMQRLTDADSEVLGKVIAADPSRDYVDLALSRFEKAGSFRHAEALCESLVLPLATVFVPDDIGRIAEAFVENSQITYANAIPGMYLELFAQTELIAGETRKYWKKISAKIHSESGISGGKPLRAAIVNRYRTA